jgi:hypothetical protein
MIAMPIFMDGESGNAGWRSKAMMIPRINQISPLIRIINRFIATVSGRVFKIDTLNFFPNTLQVDLDALTSPSQAL